MKRKLSLLLAMVLAMTMVMGIGLTAFAIDRPASAPLGEAYEEAACTEHPEATHFYSFGETYMWLGEILEVAGILYYNRPESLGTGVGQCGWGLDNDGVDLQDWNWPQGIDEGWYYQDDGYWLPCTCHQTPDPDPTPTSCGSSAPAHVHSFKWQTITAPTKDTDGLEGEMCSCGATRNTQPLSAYVYALNEYATPMINAAKPGQTITFEFGEWNSFPKSFMAKLVDKSAQNVTFVFKYKWNHKLQTITIPAGTPIDLNFDWYGPAKMAEFYGAN